MTHTKSNVIQYNEYYPFGMNTANSWTRENTTGNNFLGNGGTELNTTSSVYDLHFRNYDPVLGRMNQIDPMATSFAGLSPYNYSFNDPVTYNDPLGDCPTCPKYQRSDDTWWVADRRTLYESKYSGHSSLEDWLYNNQGSMYPSTNPWAWTGMSGSDIYGAPLDGLFLGRGHYADVALDFDKNGQFGYWIVGGIPSRFILRNGVKYEVISAGVQATFVPLDRTKANAKEYHNSNLHRDSQFLRKISGGLLAISLPFQQGFERASLYGKPPVWMTTSIRLDKTIFGRRVVSQPLFTMNAVQAGKWATGFKIVSKTIGIAGGGLALYDMQQNGVTTSNALDLVMSGLAVSGIGTSIAATYFILNAGSILFTGKNIGQHIDALSTNLSGKSVTQYINGN